MLTCDVVCWGATSALSGGHRGGPRHGSGVNSGHQTRSDTTTQHVQPRRKQEHDQPPTAGGPSVGLVTVTSLPTLGRAKRRCHTAILRGALLTCGEDQPVLPRPGRVRSLPIPRSSHSHESPHDESAAIPGGYANGSPSNGRRCPKARGASDPSCATSYQQTTLLGSSMTGLTGLRCRIRPWAAGPHLASDPSPTPATARRQSEKLVPCGTYGEPVELDPPQLFTRGCGAIRSPVLLSPRGTARPRLVTPAR
jgi:hypothetical protein